MGLVEAVNPRRIAQDLQRLSRIGATPNGGVTRLAYTEAEREAHRWVAKKMQEAGLAVRVDSVGNTIGRRTGRDDSLPLLALGSHLDSVFEGGNFDGTVGVVGALEAIRVLDEQGVTTHHPLAVIAFAAEEGARFGAASLGSKAIAGELAPAELHRLRDHEGISLAEAMGNLGFDPADIALAKWEPKEIGGFLELHIEQAGVLEGLGKAIGIVEAIGAATRLRVRLKGRADHSGATPMTLRKDTLAAAAEMILHIERIAREEAGRSTVATVGRVKVSPGVITVIPGQVEMDVDIRDIDAEMKRMARLKIEEMIHEVSRHRGIAESIDLLADQQPTTLPVWTRETIRGVCQELRLGYRVMPTGAQHDTGIMANITPAAMILVPSKNGVSHSPEEWTDISDIATAVKVQVNSLLRLDEALLQHQTRVKAQT